LVRLQIHNQRAVGAASPEGKVVQAISKMLDVVSKRQDIIKVGGVPKYVSKS
jgi:hypothetical protein